MKAQYETDTGTYILKRGQKITASRAVGSLSKGSPIFIENVPVGILNGEPDYLIGEHSAGPIPVALLLKKECFEAKISFEPKTLIEKENQ